MSKVKSIFKRSLAILLAMLTVLSVGITSAIALNLEMAQTAGYVDLAETGAAEKKNIYYDNTSKKWSGTIYCYAWDNNGNTNAAWPGQAMTLVSGKTYKINLDNKYTQIIFNNNSSQSSNLKAYYGLVYNGSSWAEYDTSRTADLSAVIKNEKVMFYIGHPTNWNQQVFALGDSDNNIIDAAKYVKTKDSRYYAPVASPVSGTFKMSWDTTWTAKDTGSAINPESGRGYIVTNNGTSSTTTVYGTKYTVAPTLDSNTISQGQKATISSFGFSPATKNFTSSVAFANTDVTFYVLDNSSAGYTELSVSDSTLDTSALAVGTYTIVPILDDGYVYTRGTTITLTVSNPNYSYSVVANPKEGGTATHEGTGSVTPGSGVTVKAEAEEGYTFTGWTASGNGTFDDASALSTTFYPAANGETATANFTAINYPVTFIYGVNGEKSTTIQAAYGSTPTAPTAEEVYVEGYTFDGWTPTISAVPVDGATYTAKYTINSYNLTISGFDSSKATMKIDDEPYTADTVITKTYDSTSTVTITPNEGQVLSVNDVEVPYGESYTTTITYNEDQTLSLEFNVKYFDVTITHGQGRSKSVSIGNTQYTVGPTSVTNSIPYGTQTLSIAAPDNYYIASVVGNGVNYTDDGSMADSMSTDIFVTDDCEITINIQSMPKFDLKVEQTGFVTGKPSTHFALSVAGVNHTTDGPAATVTENLYGGEYEITVTAPENYYIPELWVDGAQVITGADSYTTPYYALTYKVNLTKETNVKIVYKYNPVVNITTYTDNKPETIVNDPIGYGNSYTIEVPKKEGYYISSVQGLGEGVDFTNGTDDSFTYTIDFLSKDVSVTATYTPVTGTINVTAGEGGTVDNAGGTVTYPTIVTATATPNKSEGYEFTHWTVESAGKKDTDYKVTEKDNVIEVQILTQDTVVNVTANFANAHKIKVYTYSDSGFDRLTITETKGSTTNTPVNNVTQSTVTFGDETWYTPGEVSLTPGFNTSITAQMFGDNPLVGGTGNLVMFQDTLGWGQVYFYNKSTSMYLPDVHTDKKDKAVCTEGVTAKPMSRIGTSNYYYIYVTESVDYIAFSKDGQSNYFWMYATQACYRGNDTGHKASTPMFVPTNKVSYSTNGTNYYNEGSWKAAPPVDTDTDRIDITKELYDGNTWKGLDEIWIYIKADGTYIATTVNRRQLIDYVGSSLIKRTYNNGVNDMEYKSNLWTAFKNAYTAALDASGDYTLTEAQLKTKYNALLAAYEALEVEPNIKITGSHGAEPKSSANVDYHYGVTSFPGINTSTASGNIGDQNDDDWYHFKTSYIYATIERGTTITINTNLESAYEADYLVYGWVVNGTEWVPATQDIEDTSKYVGTYKCDKSATFVPIYFRKDTIANWETDDNIVKIYASTEGASSKWGNYISAYTWTTDKSYYQFGHWTGQLMIPDTANPGMYYTFLEFKSPTGNSDVAGIAFTNYGGNTPINTNARYQTYDYYEFKELKSLGYNNIVFQLKTFEGNENYPSASKTDLSKYQFDYFRDFSGNIIDITREKLVEGRALPDPELYIVRTGPVAAYSGYGYRQDLIKGSDYYVDTYVYDKNGNFLVACKSFELLDLATLATKSGKPSLAQYAGAPVMVDYASLTTSGANGENKRFDGEWFGTIYGLTNVTIKTEVAFQNEDGTIKYFPGQNEVEDVGNAYFNGLHFQEVSHGSENHTISSIVADGNDFVGWYKATVADDGTYTIDATAKPLFTERSVSTIDASADAVYVAVFKTHPEGTFTVNNYYYTYDDFKGQPMGEHLPPVFGNDTTYSIRDVRIKKLSNYNGTPVVDGDPGFAGTYTQSMAVAAGDVLEITIKTTPTYTRDYVYAWYIQANEADGKINFEEVGTDVIQGDTTPGKTKEFTFTYTVEAGVDTITIYSDVVHISPKVTFTYIYNNRYNQEQKYIVNYTLTDAELKNFDNLKDNAEFNTKIHNLAPFVGDLYKNVTWEIENISADATNWTLRASEDDIYTVNVNVGEEHKTFTGKFNSMISIYAKDIDESFTGNRGIWYLDNSKPENGEFDPGVDEILGYGTYYGLVITGDANVYFANKDLETQIILADAVYGYERATDGSGNVTTNKVYVDYLISMLLNVYTGGYIDCNNNNQQDENEPTVIDEENTNAPVSLKAIEAAGYKVDYGMVHELLNTFSDATREEIKEAFYSKPSNKMNDDELVSMLINAQNDKSGVSYKGATYTTKGGNEMLATLLYKYSAIHYNDFATNKNRVIMTFGYDNTDYYRSLYYNVKAYLAISAKGTETMTKENTMFKFSNSATLNIAEADEITNGNTTNP